MVRGVEVATNPADGRQTGAAPSFRPVKVACARNLTQAVTLTVLGFCYVPAVDDLGLEAAGVDYDRRDFLK